MTTKHINLLRSIPVPPAGSEENFAYMTVEQILNFAFNRYWGNLCEQGYLSEKAKSASTAWIDGHPGPVLQLKFDTMDQVQERFTPNVIRMARDYYGERPFKPHNLTPSEAAVHNPALGKNHLYQLLKDFALSQSTKHFQNQQENSCWEDLRTAVQRQKQHNHGNRMLRLLRLAMAVPSGGDTTVNNYDVAFLNGAGTHFLAEEKRDPCFAYALDLLNGLAFLAQDHTDFVPDVWEPMAYNPEISLRKSFDNLHRFD